MRRLPRGLPPQDHNRIARAGTPKWRQLQPALGTPTENANLLLNKQVATLARAGSNPGNPIMAGMGVRFQLGIARRDQLTGVFLFQKRTRPGNNLLASVSQAGFFGTMDTMAGSGLTLAGDHVNGAKRNFVRIDSKRGSFEREFWISSYGPSVVTLDGTNALDDSLNPVQVSVPIVDNANEWLDIPVDFMPDWNDEFQALHRAGAEQEEAGFRKAYGGAMFVSFFDTTPGTEGVGVECNPVTTGYIFFQRTLQVQNTPGLKHITARFRSAVDSVYVVDVPLLVLVVEQTAETCTVPLADPCADPYLKKGTALPADVPGEPSEPEVQVEAGTEGAILSENLLVIQMRGQTAGPAPTMVIDLFSQVASSPALAGARFAQVGSQLTFYPLATPAGGSPTPPYGAPKRFSIAFSVSDLKAQNVALIVAHIKDGDHISAPMVVNGPAARSIGFMPIGGTGGGPTCAY